MLDAVSNLNSGTTQGKIRKPAEFLDPICFLRVTCFLVNYVTG